MKIRIYYMIILLCFSCSENNRNTEEEKEVMNTNTVELLSDTGVVEIDSLIQPTSFDLLMNQVNDSMVSWGFVIDPKGVKEIKPEDYERHWYLRSYFRGSIHRADTMPTDSDFSAINTIRQITYRKNWKWVIEEWEFTDRHMAEKWLFMINKNRRMDDQKPPREYWLEDNRIYFLMATAARDWFEYGDKLTELASGYNRPLGRLLFQPLDLAKFKEKKGGSNSGNHGGNNYWLRPDMEGFYYYYTLFNTPRELRETERFGGFKLYTYKIGTDAGFYEDENEIFTGLMIKYSDFDLGHLNLVGKSESEIINRLGQPHFKEDNTLIYSGGERCLFLHLNAGLISTTEYYILKENYNSGTLRSISYLYR